MRHPVDRRTFIEGAAAGAAALAWPARMPLPSRGFDDHLKHYTSEHFQWTVRHHFHHGHRLGNIGNRTDRSGGFL